MHLHLQEKQLHDLLLPVCRYAIAHAACLPLAALLGHFLPRLGPPARVAPLLCNPRLRSSTGPSVLARLLSAHTGCRSDHPRRRTVQARVAQVCVPQDRVVQVGPAQVGPKQARPGEVCPVQVRVSQVGPEEVGVAQIGLNQVRPGEIGLAQVWAGFGVLAPPLVPDLHALFEPRKVLFVCHRTPLLG